MSHVACPFCKLNDGLNLIDFDLGEDNYLYYVQCEYCHAQGPHAITPWAAWRLWGLSESTVQSVE